MGILDDLREEASQKDAQQQENTRLSEQLEHNYQVLILPKMQQLFAYFKELLAYLELIESPIEVTDYTKRYSELGTLYQQDYKLSTDQYGGITHHDKLTEITLRFACLGHGDDDQEFIYHAKNKIEADQEKHFLFKNKLKFHYNKNLGNTKEGAITLFITKKIPVLFKFEVDYENSVITLQINNHEDFEQRTQTIEPKDINEAYMDKLARYILRKDTDFLRIDIDDIHKKQIRQQLEAQKQQRDQELKDAHIRETAEQESAEKKRLSYKLKSFFNI